MRIRCPFCGERVHSEFAYLGDAGPMRPKPPAGGTGADPALVHDYVYLRENPAGRHREFWQHSGGCRAWLIVERDVTTHAIASVMIAGEAADPTGSAGR